MDKMKRISPFIIWFLAGLLLGAGALLAWNHYMVKDSANAISQAEQAQVKEIIAKVGKLMLLPTGEEPVVATISDAASLVKEQVFYKGAKNGDVVIVYQKAAKAILYSPDRNIIINVGPVSIQDEQSSSSKPDSTSSPVASSSTSSSSKK